DDRIRTAAGYVVDPAEITEKLEDHPGVMDSVVVSLETRAGPVLGVLVQTSGPLHSVELRSHLARSLPRWAQPRVLETIPELPRLASGRTDRRACAAILERLLPRNDAG